MEKINNYKSILLDVLENTNYKRLILCENINGFIYNILTEKGIKFKNYDSKNEGVLSGRKYLEIT